MRIAIQHHFEGASLATVEQLYMLDHDFNTETFAVLGYERRVLRSEARSHGLVRTLCLYPKHALPAPFSKLIPGESFHVREHVEYDFERHSGTWTTTPSVLSGRFEAAGTFGFEVDATGVLFRLDGSVRSTIPLLGRAAAKHAVHMAEQQHAALARAVRARFAQDRR